MLTTLILSASILGQDASDFVAGYDPEPGDKLVLALPGGGRFYVASDYLTFNSLDKAVDANDSTGLDQMLDKGHAAIVNSGTPVLYIKRYDYRKIKQADISEVRILDGIYKDKVVFAHTVLVRKLDSAKQEARARAEAEARAWAEKKAKRGPLDEKKVVADLQSAIKAAKAQSGKLSPYQAKLQKEQIMKKAIEGVCKKHIADLDEVNAITTNAKVYVNFDGQKFDVAGSKVK